MSKPNIIFIMTDHQRADSIGMVQAGIEVTPNLNRLASKGLVFNRAYNTCPLCVPARTALATSRYPTNNSVVYNDWKGNLAGNHKPIHQYLYEADYDVAHVGEHHIRIKPSLQERVPFKKWITKEEYCQYLEAKGIDIKQSTIDKTEVWENKDTGERFRQKYSNTRASVWHHPIEDFRDYYYCEESVEFINQKHDKPYALFTYLWAPHPPLNVPNQYASKFDPQSIELPSNVGMQAQNEPPNRRDGIAAQLTENIEMKEWRQAWAAHLGLVHFADAQIGRMMDAFEESGQADNTIIVFTVDHGDHLGQHKMYQKMEMYEQAVRVPLIMCIPDTVHKEINTVISHLDIMPTLLDLIGIDYEELDGFSFEELIFKHMEDEDRKAFCQYSGNPWLGDIRRSVITSRYKYIYDTSNVTELYDLKNDPLEMENLASDEKYKKVVEYLHQEYKCWAEKHGDWVKF